MADWFFFTKESVFSVFRGILAVAEEGAAMFQTTRAWMVVIGLGPAAPGDANAACDLRADFVADEVLDFFDLQVYLNAYSSGCP